MKILKNDGKQNLRFWQSGLKHLLESIVGVNESPLCGLSPSKRRSVPTVSGVYHHRVWLYLWKLLEELTLPKSRHTSSPSTLCPQIGVSVAPDCKLSSANYLLLAVPWFVHLPGCFCEGCPLSSDAYFSTEVLKIQVFSL